jgi:hypothetical protein
MAGLIRRIAIGQVLPGRARAKDPQNAIQDVARIAPRPSTPIPPQPRLRQQRFEDGPLRVSEVHAVEVRRSIIFRSHPADGVYEIGSSVMSGGPPSDAREAGWRAPRARQQTAQAASGRARLSHLPQLIPSSESFDSAFHARRLASSGVGRMTTRADFHFDVMTSGAGRKCIAADATHQRLSVRRMNAFLHESLPSS